MEEFYRPEKKQDVTNVVSMLKKGERTCKHSGIYALYCFTMTDFHTNFGNDVILIVLDEYIYFTISKNLDI